MPSETVMVPKRSPTPPASRTPSFAFALNRSSERLHGVISFHDVAKAVLEEQSFENRMLKAYIRDWPAEG